ncbi:unnamed protein product [Caenorhabditis brenneri]
MTGIKTIFASEGKENAILVEKTFDPVKGPATKNCRRQIRFEECLGLDASATENKQNSFDPRLSLKRCQLLSRTVPVEDRSFINENTLISQEESASKVSQVGGMPRKRDNTGFDGISTAKRNDARREKLIIEEPDSEDETEFDYGPGGHLDVDEETLLASRYEIIKLLGYGVYGAVYLAMDTEECEKVALKIGRSGDKATSNSSKEIEFSRLVNKSSNCVRLLDSFEESGPHGKHSVLVFEVLGPNLFDLLYKSNQAELTTHRLKQFLKNILKGLVHIHDDCQMIHGDLKPANLMISVPQSETGTSSYNVYLHDPCSMTNLKIGDFGLSCSKTDTIEWSFQTCAYRAPESFLVSNISTPVDIWSLGCIMYEMATKDQLFECDHGDPLQETSDHLSKIASELGPIESSAFVVSDTNQTVFKKVFGRKRVFCRELAKNPKLSVKNIQDKSQLSAIEAELFYDLLMQFLKLDPNERITAKEALQHPFLMG